MPEVGASEPGEPGGSGASCASGGPDASGASGGPGASSGPGASGASGGPVSSGASGGPGASGASSGPAEHGARFGAAWDAELAQFEASATGLARRMDVMLLTVGGVASERDPAKRLEVRICLVHR